jgi:hypothetical protein
MVDLVEKIAYVLAAKEDARAHLYDLWIASSRAGTSTRPASIGSTRIEADTTAAGLGEGSRSARRLDFSTRNRSFDVRPARYRS